MIQTITIQDASELRKGDVVENGEPFSPIYETILSDPIVTADYVECVVSFVNDENGVTMTEPGRYWRGYALEIEREV